MGVLPIARDLGWMRGAVPHDRLAPASISLAVGGAHARGTVQLVG